MTAIELVDSLKELRSEFDVVNPSRDKSSDGWIGDARHAATISDHNPDAQGLVHAIDVDVDGVPMAHIVAWLAARCRAGLETRAQYMIFRRVIWSRSWGFTPKVYTGLDPHTSHLHVSARHDVTALDGHSWGVAAEFGPDGPSPRPPAPIPPAGGHAAGSRQLVLRTPALAGADVSYVQKWIGSPCGRADGFYGPSTVAGVKWYQAMRGIARDGIVGPTTWRNLGVRYTGS